MVQIGAAHKIYKFFLILDITKSYFKLENGKHIIQREKERKKSHRTTEVVEEENSKCISWKSIHKGEQQTNPIVWLLCRKGAVNANSLGTTWPEIGYLDYNCACAKCQKRLPQTNKQQNEIKAITCFQTTYLRLCALPLNMKQMLKQMLHQMLERLSTKKCPLSRSTKQSNAFYSFVVVYLKCFVFFIFATDSIYQ